MKKRGDGMSYVVHLAAYETEAGRAKWLGEDRNRSTHDAACAARMSRVEAERYAKSFSRVSGGYGWHAVPAHLAEAGYDIMGQGVGAGYKVSLQGTLLAGGPYPSREKAWAAAEKHIAR